MRILLVDDHALFARSLEIVLADFPEIERFSSVKSLAELERSLLQERPDILLMDINLGKLSSEDGSFWPKHSAAISRPEDRHPVQLRSSRLP